ncbi:glycosyltransferase family 9 protein [Haliovirga abyssi]|uniref:Heptosyltransferase I n=1 Tax=Haliovirga abyssi TaxID=2996794 RepID=A0AAU9DVE1_9FUSO|nr:glycosyltransferase family 9 protein [Haliovirga abyssi]BDU50086.1 heptosyltransferase I [Haliovirga abyssi]
MGIKKVILVRMGALGDLIKITPIIERFYELGIKVDVITDSEYSIVLSEYSKINKIYSIDRKDIRDIFNKNDNLIYYEMYDKLYKIFQEINSSEYDLVINLGVAKYPIIIASMIKAKDRKGIFLKGKDLLEFYGDEKGYFAYKTQSTPSENLKLNRKENICDYFFDVAGIKNNFHSVSIEIKKNIEINSNNLIGIHIGAGWKTKKYILEKWGNVCSGLLERGFDILLNGVEQEKDEIEFLRKSVLEKREKNLKNRGELFVNYNMSEFDKFVTLKNIKLLISTDSGPASVAAALGKPVITLFGATDMYNVAPYSENSFIINSKERCTPCLKETCDKNMECMRNISGELILETVEYILEGKRKKINSKDVYRCKFNKESRLEIVSMY